MTSARAKRRKATGAARWAWVLTTAACLFLPPGAGRHPRGGAGGASTARPAEGAFQREHPDWWATIAAALDEDRRQVLPSGTGGERFVATAKGFRAFFGNDGVEVAPESASWRWKFSLESVGGRKVAPALPSADGTRVVYRRGGVTETYENRPEGLEQRFEVAQAPEDGGPLVIDGRVEAPGGLTRDPQALGFGAGREDTLRYGELKVFDADGRQLRASLEWSAPRPGSGRIRIVVEEEGRYPLVIDPLISAPAWQMSGASQLGAAFGYSVSGAGDVNRDGYSDVIVGEFSFNGAAADMGKAYVFLGSATGLSTGPAWQLVGASQAGAGFGYSVSGAGDVNGDGFSDVVVGEPYFDGAAVDMGKAYVFLGSATGLSTGAAWQAVGASQATADFGFNVSGAGDVNGDGFSDVIVGEYLFDGAAADMGKAYVFLGSGTGLTTGAAWQAVGAAQVNAELGSSVSGAGDVNRDGYSDVVVGEPLFDGAAGNMGRAYVFLGSATGLTTGAAWQMVGASQAGAQFGNAVSAAGDVNGDGFPDVVVGEWSFSGTAAGMGKAYLFLGSATGLTTGAGWQVVGASQVTGEFGLMVSGAGDVNGDGFSDVVVAEPFFDGAAMDMGKAYVFLGSASGLTTSAAWQVVGSSQASAGFGIPVSGAGDINGDGFSDIIGGEYAFDGAATDVGKAYAFLGSATGLTTSAAWQEVGASQSSGHFGLSVSGAGDVNGDGFSDVVVGEYYFDGSAADMGKAYVFLGSTTGFSTGPAWQVVGAGQAGAQFGYSVAAAGDVNADGYSDVIIGEVGFSGAASAMGKVYVFLGSATGLSTAAAWQTLGASQGTAWFGFAVSGAGDVNGDGFSDVVAGEAQFDGATADMGKAYVFLGSATGLTTSAAWQVVGASQAGANLGYAVSVAGDVNGDGFSDIIVGESSFDGAAVDMGKAYVFLGSATGLSTGAGWQMLGASQAGAAFGASVAAAGDVNGDGFSDVIVGEYLFDGVAADMGKTYVFLGGEPPGGTLRLAQFESNGVMPVPVGDILSVTPDTAVLKATLVSSPMGQKVALEVELKPVGVAFDGLNTVKSAPVFSGNPVSVTVGGLAAGASYHWRARPTYPVTASFKGPLAGRWLAFDTANPAAADFRTGSDAGSSDGGPVDAGSVDAGGPDAGGDAGMSDAGAPDAGVTDAGKSDGGEPDAGAVDAGALDGGCAAPMSIVRDANLFAAVGVAYMFNATGQVNVTGGSGPVSFTSCAVPPVSGFQVDPATGLIAWTPLAAGTASLCLHAQDSCGSDSYPFDVVVAAAPLGAPVARITALPPAASVLEPISFSGSASTVSPGASLVSYQWAFGDGALDTGVGLSHSYALSGGYTVHLTVTDNFGSQGSTSVEVVVRDAECANPPAVEALAVPVHGADSLTVKFGCNCTTASARAWDFGDGTGSSEAEPSHTYGPGRYRAWLWGMDENGCVGSDTVDVVVDNPPNLPPLCRASATPAAGSAPLPVTFTAAYVDPNPDGLITRAEWTFEDDGSTRMEPVVVRTFDTPATYRATLRVENNRGLACTDRVEVVVQTAAGETPPRIFTVPSKEAVCRSPYHYARELEDRPLARGTRPLHWYSGVGTPRTLAVDGTTGRVQWTPSNAGAERINLIASNPAGTAGQSYQVDVVCGEAGPVTSSCGCQGSQGLMAELALALLAVVRRRPGRRRGG